MDTGVACAALVRRVAALPELAMRRAVLAESLAAMAPGPAVDLMAHLLARGRREGPPFEVALMAMVRMLAPMAVVPYEVAASWYASARERGHDDFARLLFAATPAAATSPARTAPTRILLARDGRPLTLGERKWIARGPRTPRFERLLHDPAPAVMRILLGNPHLRESDVVALAARRPATGEQLAEVFAADRWLARYAVKVALAANPYTPTDITLKLLGFLRRPDLKAIALDGTAAPIVRAASAAMLERDE